MNEERLDNGSVGMKTEVQIPDNHITDEYSYSPAIPACGRWRQSIPPHPHPPNAGSLGSSEIVSIYNIESYQRRHLVSTSDFHTRTHMDAHTKTNILTCAPHIYMCRNLKIITRK